MDVCTIYPSVCLGLSLPAMLILKSLQGDHAGGYEFILADCRIAIPAFVIKGAAFYVFLFSVLFLNEIIA
jgi:hypothetical protein